MGFEVLKDNTTTQETAAIRERELVFFLRGLKSNSVNTTASIQDKMISFHQHGFLALETNTSAVELVLGIVEARGNVFALVDSPNEENAISFPEQAGQEIDVALTSLTKLEPNWDEYGTQPPNSTAVENARKVIKVLSELNLPSPYLAPSSDEGVTISFLRKKKVAAIECFNTGEIISLTSDGTGSPSVWEVGESQTALRQACKEIEVFLLSD